MGFFKKIFKGVKKVFKKVGKAVKSAFKSVGKFMGKIGIVGQLAVGLFMPYALGFLGSTLGGWAGTLMQSSNAFVSGAGKFLNAAVKMGTRVGQAFSSVTEAVKTTIGDMVGATLNKIPGAGDFIKGFTKGRIDITGKTFSGAWEATQKAWTNAGDSLGNIFSKSTFDSSANKFLIEENLAKSVTPEKIMEGGTSSYNVETGELEFREMGLDQSFKDLTGAGEVYPAASAQDYSKMLTSQDALLSKPIDMQKVPGVTDFSVPSVEEAIAGKATNKFTAAELGSKVGDLAVDVGLPTTGTQVVSSLLNEDEMGGGTYVDRRSTMVVQGGGIPSIYPSASQMEYGDMMSSYYPQYNAPSMVDAILNQDWGSIYGQGYFGFPSLQAGLANSAGR